MLFYNLRVVFALVWVPQGHNSSKGNIPQHGSPTAAVPLCVPSLAWEHLFPAIFPTFPSTCFLYCLFSCVLTLAASSLNMFENEFFGTCAFVLCLSELRNSVVDNPLNKCFKYNVRSWSIGEKQSGCISLIVGRWYFHLYLDSFKSQKKNCWEAGKHSENLQNWNKNWESNFSVTLTYLAIKRWLKVTRENKALSCSG